MRLGYPMVQSGVQSGQFADKYTVRPINRTIMFRISPDQRSLNTSKGIASFRTLSFVSKPERIPNSPPRGILHRMRNLLATRIVLKI
jgi:hypothetical protein